MNLQNPAPTRRATYKDVIDAPEHMVAEIVRGVLSLQPRPRLRHARAIKALGVRLGGPFDLDKGSPGGWEILIEPELHFGEDVLVPDLAGWRRERLPRLPDEAWFTLAPDWACEVLSPSTRARDLTDKRAIYAEQGVAWLWFVDPEARTLEVFALREGAWTLALAISGDAEAAAPPFEAAPFALGDLWAE